MLQQSTERFIVSIVDGIDDEDGTLCNGELGVEAAMKEWRPRAEKDSMSIDLTIATLEDNVGVLRVVEDGRVACFLSVSFSGRGS